MTTNSTLTKLCETCSKLNTDRITHPLQPCHKPLPCSTPPRDSTSLNLGSIGQIKRRRQSCHLCQLIAQRLDREPSDLSGECHVKESEEFCNFCLPSDVEPSTTDPSVTHFHLTQTVVIFEPSVGGLVQGPSLPWQVKERDATGVRFVIWLQAKAKSCEEGGDRVTSRRTEQGFLDTIGGRYVSTQIDPQLVRSWLHLCQGKHGNKCMPSSSRLAAEHYTDPAFVVDAIDACVVPTPSRCRYIALSYVWGTATMFKHLRANTHDLQIKGSLQSPHIPSTIRDAIALVRAIGERYLWVDSLCIIQDDLKMQQTEILRMGSIYSQALFTIIAAFGDNADSGLPGVEHKSREQPQKILKFANGELLTVVDVRYTPNGIDDTPWAKRAWTFQERVLSNRVLVFSENQVYWSCRTAVYSEERVLEEVREVDQRYPSFPQNNNTDELSWESLQQLDYLKLYSNLLSNYRQRRLTYQTDLLNAFDGVAGILSSLQKDTFVWGLPESLFSYALTWFFSGRSARNHVQVPIFKSDGSKQMVPIPSWSWGAWSADNPNQPFVIHGGESPRFRNVNDFYIVDANRELVRIKERLFTNPTPSAEADDARRPGWLEVQTPWHPLPSSLAARQADRSFPRLDIQVGQLCFWASVANLGAVRRWRLKGPGEVEYLPFFDAREPNMSGAYHNEIVQQDFIVVARLSYGVLVLLAVEWKDGVAYRVGKAEVFEKDWVEATNNLEWRLIVLG